MTNDERIEIPYRIHRTETPTEKGWVEIMPIIDEQDIYSLRLDLAALDRRVRQLKRQLSGLDDDLTRHVAETWARLQELDEEAGEAEMFER